jgi:hypothetical protein
VEINFLVPGQPEDVLSRLEVPMTRRGFGINSIASGERTKLYNGFRQPSIFAELTGWDTRVTLLASEEGEGQTRLSALFSAAAYVEPIRQAVIDDLGGTPLDEEAAASDEAPSAPPVYKKGGVNVVCRVFDDRIEVQTGSGAAEIMRLSEIKEVRTGWGRLRAFAKVVVEDLDGRELEVGMLHMLEARRLKKKIEEQLDKWADELIAETSHHVAEPWQPTEPPKNLDIPDQIKKLAELRSAGVLTAEEFERKKNELLDRM